MSSVVWFGLAAVRAGAPELQRRRAPGIRGGHTGLGRRRGRHGPRPRPRDAGVHRVAGVRKRVLLPVPAADAAATRLGAAGARGRRLRRACLLHGAAIWLRRRPVPLRCRVPDHPRRRQPLRQEVPSPRCPQRGRQPPSHYLHENITNIFLTKKNQEMNKTNSLYR
jgi:hypothetical protein